MGDVFRFKVGDRVTVGTRQGKVVAVIPGKDAYQVEMDEDGVTLTVQSRLVREAKETPDNPAND